MIFMFPGHRMKALTLSYDDGVEQDIRLMDILDRSGILATFNLNSGCFSPEGTVFPEDQVHRRLSEKGALSLYGTHAHHEVAVHGLCHAHPTDLSPADRLYEFSEDRRRLEALFGRIIRGAAYAYGQFDDETVETLRACGLVYARGVHSTHSFDIPRDFLRLQPTCHHDDPELFALWNTFVTTRSDRPQLFYLWGHSYEFEAHDNWQRMEDFCLTAGGHPDVWYCTNLQLYDYVDACRRVQKSFSHSLIHNPSALSVCFKDDQGKQHTVAPGETISL
ncbi:MAG: polysaccharide deacetylase family protein [Clostridia bacterium]|nr:polysaccharide deacetylase family protein [Clostridia bacterium]